MGEDAMLRRYVSALALGAICSTTVFAASGKSDPGLNAFQRFNGGPPTPPIFEPEKPKAPRPSEIEKKASESAAALRAQEEAKLLRRLAVCDQIKKIALEQGDAKLEDEAIRMEQKAEEVYRQRTKNLANKSAASDGEARK
jgi:hypothetical protein